MHTQPPARTILDMDRERLIGVLHWIIRRVRSIIIFQFAAVDGWVQTVRTLKKHVTGYAVA